MLIGKMPVISLECLHGDLGRAFISPREASQERARDLRRRNALFRDPCESGERARACIPAVSKACDVRACR